MKVKSKLADIDFEFGRFEYKKDHLIVHSDVRPGAPVGHAEGDALVADMRQVEE